MGIDWEGLLGEEGYAEVCAHGFDDYGYDAYGSSCCYEDDCDRKEDFDSDDSCEE